MKMNYLKFDSQFKRLLGISLLMFVMILSGQAMSAQSNKVKGKVSDELGEPVIGATVVVKGTTVGTITDFDGRYEITAGGDQTLSFSFLGYSPQTIKIGNRSVIDVILAEDAKTLDEVVVVGYGTQLRRNVVGAVEHFKGEILENRPNAYLLRSLQGQVPGLNISMVDGKPSRSAAVNIRGTVQSIGAGGSTLTLIDGVEGDLTAMNPEDVESVSVLKDAASTAVYGTRGAFGVILVTTKKAKEGRISVNYSGNATFYKPTVRPQYEKDSQKWYDGFISSYRESKHADPGGINNFFDWNTGWESEFKKRANDPNNSYDSWRINDAGKYEYFGNTDWYNEFYRNTTFGHQHNLSVSGGSEKVNFMVSGRFFEQDGTYRIGDEKFRQMNVRAKGSVQITKWLNIENSTDFVRRTYHQPMGYNTDLTIPRLLEHQGFPVTNIRNVDGSWTAAAVVTGYAGMYEGSTYRDNFKYDMKNSTFLTADFLEKQLVFKADFSYLYNHSRRTDVVNPSYYKLAPNTVAGYPTSSFMDQRDYDKEYYNTNVYASYTPKLSNIDHSINLVAGYNVEEQNYKQFGMWRDGFLDPKKPNFSLMDGTDIRVNGNSHYSWATQGIFFRGSYGYQGKYLAEVSGRYDGSSKFPQGQVWGFFPAASVGWRMSGESFMKDLTWLDNLKWRLSVGSAGNGNMPDAYGYIPKMSVIRSGGVLTNGTKESYTGAPEMMPNSLTWERSTTYNAGLDMDFLDGRLNFMGDIYRKEVTDMYVVGAEIPAVAGYNAPKGNNADMRTNGFELSVAWQDKFAVKDKPFSYNVRLSLWDATSKITRYTAKNNILPSIYKNSYYEGMTLGEIWGYHVDGLFATDEEAKEWGEKAQSKTFWSGDATSWGAGDIKFADLNGDGKVDDGNGTLEDHGDLKKIGNTTPRYHFGLNLGANWNGIGISAFFQGVMKRDWYPAGESGFFWGQYNRAYGFALPWHNEDRWTEENQDVNAYWPRLRSYLSSTGRGTLRAPNDKYLQNARYIRLKNITVDYTLPKHIVSKMHLESVRLYVTGENLYFWSPLKKHAKNFDPEQITAGDSDYAARTGTDGEGYGYPQTRSVSFGVNVSF